METSKKLYVVRHIPNHCGEIVWANSKGEACELASRHGFMSQEPVSRLMKHSYLVKKDSSLYKKAIKRYDESFIFANNV